MAERPAPPPTGGPPDAPTRREIFATGRRALLEPPLEPPRSRRLLEALAPYGLCVLLAGALALVLGLWVHAGATAGPVTWARWWALLALPLVLPPLCFVYFHRDRRRSPTFQFTRTGDVRAARRGIMPHLSQLPNVLRLGAVSLVIVALARPQRPSNEVQEVEGIDIVVALDVSNSMSERDLAPDRLSAAKRVLKKFIQPRKSDRIGLVIFGREAFTQCPLTLDHGSLLDLLDDVRLDLIDGRGTAIGNALVTALNRLVDVDKSLPPEERDQHKKGSKVIILLTDGDNNAGKVSPLFAASSAQVLGVKVFTVLMGNDAAPPPPGSDRAGLFVRPPPRYPVNPKLLQDIAAATGGSPYLATDDQALERDFQAILDELDKSRLADHVGRPSELYPPFVWAAMILLLLEVALVLTRFRRFP